MADDPLGDLDLSAFGAAGPGRDARDTYEDGAVRAACRLIGLPGLARAIAAEAAARTGDPSCRFALFDEMTGFPVRLRVGRLRGVRFLALPDLFDRFPRTPIGAALAVLAAELDPAEGPIGLVFRWAGARDDAGRQRTIKGAKFMAAHTAPSVAGDSVRVIAPMKLAGAACDVTVQTLPALLAAYAGWTPPA